MLKSGMVKVSFSFVLLTALLFTFSTPASAAETLSEAFSEAELGYQFRWRLEHVDQEPLPHNSVAIPLRARIHLHTADLYGFSAKVELDYIVDFGLDSYNAGGGNTPNPPGYPVIADPAGGDLNQAFLQYKAEFGGRFRLGRQRIIYDNARFIGNVGWRQNEQTYDAFTYDQKTSNGWHFQYAYLADVQRIFGDKVPAGEWNLNTNLFNVSYNIENFGKLIGYYYGIDNQTVDTLSSQSAGLRFAGEKAHNDIVFGYGLEYAHQTEYADNPVDYSADYWRGDLSVALKWATPYIGYESLGGSHHEAGQAFQTTLATLHAFDGWADKFLNTPAAGLNDAFVGVKGKAGFWKWDLIYHEFSAQSGSGDHGSEIDASFGSSFNDHYSLLFKVAFFNSDSVDYADTNKFWMQFTADF